MDCYFRCGGSCIIVFWHSHSFACIMRRHAIQPYGEMGGISVEPGMGKGRKHIFLAVCVYSIFYRHMRDLLCSLPAKPHAGATGCTLVALSFITALTVDERMPQTEAYALRTAGYTDLIIRQNGECRYYNSGEPRHADDIEQACLKFALRRRCRNIAPLPSSIARIVLADSTSIAILGGTSLAEEYAGADYLLVTKGFKGNAAEIAALRPDTVLMSSGINRRRAKRIIQELAENNVPVINLREERWRHIKD